MANHGYGHIKPKLTVEQIDSDLREINKNRFNNLFEITHEGDTGDEIWWIRLKDKEDVGFQVWLNLKKKEIEWPHTHSGESGWWFQETFMSLLISKYNGMISDDGCEGKWEPQFHIKYPHMIDWFMKSVNYAEGRFKKFTLRKIAQGYYREELKYLPKEIISVI